MNIEIADSNDGTDKIQRETHYIALVTDHFIENYLEEGNCYREAELANKLGCTMFAVVKKGTNLDILMKYPWNKIMYFTNDKDMELCVNELKRHIFLMESGK